MKTLVVIPTYNERENIKPLTSAVLEQVPEAHILVVDDSSPDGTGKIVQSLPAFDEKVFLLTRHKKEGLGRAYIAGFNWGLGKGYEVIIEMDADFSHRPEDLKKIHHEMTTSDIDFAIGSRWVDEGGTINWSKFRKAISLGGSFYSRMVLGYPVQDWTGGFNAWKRHVLEGIDLQKVQSEGYSFQIELKYRALKNGYKCKEIPILFAERRAGASKMSAAIVIEALFRVWGIRQLS